MKRDFIFLPWIHFVVSFVVVAVFFLLHFLFFLLLFFFFLMLSFFFLMLFFFFVEEFEELDSFETASSKTVFATAIRASYLLEDVQMME